ncbi:MAG TPA: CHAD domain-containing protein [Solirubrobacteraceae bacterium]|jgi:CHAD domain-containing protein|nr:CHAD domain-containing protein [Solirubrobacteraceae bacterium]
MVLVRAETGRRQARRRRSERRLGLTSGETPVEGLRRMAVAQAEIAAESLSATDSTGSEKAVHEARKSIKRARAIVRLLEGELGHETSEREQSRLRTAAAGLADARDAEVMLATLEDLTKRHRKKLGKRKGVARLHRHLAADRKVAERDLAEPANRLRVASELRAFSAGADAWQLGDRPAIDPIAGALQSLYSSGRKRMAKAGGKQGGRMHTMHRWRKRVKDLRYAAEALQRHDSSSTGREDRKRARSARAAKERRWLADLATSADELGELLGEEHDLAVLGQWISDHGASAGAGSATRRRLHKLIRRRRAKLRRRALRRGRVLYKRKPRKFMARVARAYARLS